MTDRWNESADNPERMFTFKSRMLRLLGNTWMHGASRNISPVLRGAS